ncbi:hypothetical protein ACFRKE_19850, partial [Kitasatospora indigofera]
TQEISERDRQAAVRAAAEAERAAKAARTDAAAPVTPASPAAAADETELLPRVSAPLDRTAVLPKVPSSDGDPSAARGAGARGAGAGEDAEGAIAGATDRTSVLPKVESGPDQTRELRVPAPPAAPADEADPAEEPAAAVRPRPSWAEETPMDDLPSLTDTLLGSREEWAQWEQPGPDEDGDGRGKGRKRRR